MRKIFFVLALTSGVRSVSAADGVLRVLTYQSFLGARGLAPLLQKKFNQLCKKRIAKPNCRVEFVKANELIGLVGRLRLDRRAGVTGSYSVVIGLDQQGYREAEADGLVDSGRIYDQSVFSIIVDREKVPEKNWPVSWKELPSKLKDSLLIQDPRTSSLGVAWVRALREFKLLEPSQARSVVNRVFPSWTSSYAAFLSGEGAAVWSYLTSEAFHRCSENQAKSRPRYVALPLVEGYPVQQEFVAQVSSLVRTQEMKVLQQLFIQLLTSDQEIQEKIFKTQWMYPVDKTIRVPDCFRGLTPVKSLDSAKMLDPKKLRRWIEEWTQ